MTDTTAQAAEQHKLNRLSRMLGEFEIARDLVDVYGIDTVQAAMELLLANEARDDANNDENDNDSEPALSLVDALKHRSAPTSVKSPKANKLIIMGKNKTKAVMNGVQKDTSSRSFNSAANQVSKVQKGMSEAEFMARAKYMSENGIEDHRNTNGAREELPWADGQHTPRNVANKVRMVKDAVKRSFATKAACEAEHAPHGVNRVAENILAAKVAGVSLKEYVSGQQNSAQTAAQKSIMPHKMASEQSVRNRLPPDFRANSLSQIEVQKNVADAETAIRMKSYDTRSSLPNEWKPRIEVSSDNSYKAQFGRMQADTKGGKTLDKGKPQFTHDNSLNDQGSISPNQPNVKPPKNGNPKDGVSFGARTYKTHPAQEPEQWPEEPPEGAYGFGSSISDGRGGY
jgi:hypothetical protein